MATATNVIKRGSRIPESFNRSKLQASIYAACLSVRSLDGLSKDTAESVCNSVADWLQDKPDITSSDIRRQAEKALATLHPDAAYLYKNHKRII